MSCASGYSHAWPPQKKRRFGRVTLRTLLGCSLPVSHKNTHSHTSLSLYDSWELGTRAQALLELSSPEFSVLTPPKSSIPFPPPTSLNASQNASLVDVFSIARSAISSSNDDDDNEDGEPLLGGNGSAGDPASVGVAVLLANWTGQQQRDDEDYASAATAQVDYLLGPQVPKTIDGAISHRVDQLQLWYASPAPFRAFVITVCVY